MPHALASALTGLLLGSSGLAANAYIPTEWGPHAYTVSSGIGENTNVTVVKHRAADEEPAEGVHKVEYCIVGAGPAGVSMARHMHIAKRSYALLERADVPGAFYTKYPIHRQLISINKRHVPIDHPDFRLRHDWNSLLSDDGSGPAPFTTRTKEYMPNANHLVDYIAEYAEDMANETWYNTDIAKVERVVPGDEDSDFLLTATNGNRFQCQVAIMTTGMHAPNPFQFEGGHLLTSYDLLPPPGPENEAMFEGKNVLILGAGNAGFETADAIRHFAASVTILSPDDVRIAWQTHYVGDLRVINSCHVDAFQLGAADSIETMPEAREKGFHNVIAFRECDIDGLSKICLYPKDQPELATNDELFYKYLEEDTAANGKFRKGFDIVIKSLGWRFNDTIFDEESLRPNVNGEPVSLMTGNTAPTSQKTRRFGKFAMMKGNYESVGVKNLFFAGASAHMRDAKRSSGGFIHGFRYVVRVLFRYLEYTRHSVDWPGKTVSMTSKNVASLLLHRAKTSSAIYQMFGELGDAVLLNYPKKGMATYLEEVPAALCLPGHTKLTKGLPEGFIDTSPSTFLCEGRDRMFMTMAYRHDFHGWKVLEPSFRIGSTHPSNAANSTTIHPHIDYVHGGTSRILETYHFNEDFLARFDRLWDRSFLLTWLDSALKARSVGISDYIRFWVADFKESHPNNWFIQKFVDVTTLSSTLAALLGAGLVLRVGKGVTKPKSRRR